MATGGGPTAAGSRDPGGILVAMRALALDPGEKVGWARCEVTATGRVSRLVHGITPLKDMAIALAKSFGKYDVVVVETWRLSAVHARKMVGSSLPTVQFVGMVRLLGWLHPDVKVVWQDPGTKESARKSMRVLKPEWYEIIDQGGAHDDTHDYDAIMHLWHWVWSDLIKTMEPQ